MLCHIILCSIRIKKIIIRTRSKLFVEKKYVDFTAIKKIRSYNYMEKQSRLKEQWESSKVRKNNIRIAANNYRTQLPSTRLSDSTSSDLGFRQMRSSQRVWNFARVIPVIDDVDQKIYGSQKTTSE